MTQREKELSEAITASERVLDHLYEAETNLKNAKSWGVLDIVGGGFVSTFVKREYMETAQRELWAADCYAVIVSRSGRFAALPYSIFGIYELVTEKNGSNTATTMYSMYAEKHGRGDFDLVIRRKKCVSDKAFMG